MGHALSFLFLFYLTSLSLAGDLELTDKKYQEAYKDDRDVMVLDFWASFCGPCRKLVPIMNKLGADKEITKKAGIYKVDTQSEETEWLTTNYNISTIPRVIVLRKQGNKWIKSSDTTGLVSEEEIRQRIDKALIEVADERAKTVAHKDQSTTEMPDKETHE